MSTLGFAPALLALQSSMLGGTGPAFLFQIVAIFAIFYFLLIRPQQQQKKKLEAMIKALKKGDRVLTTGGIYGTVLGIDEGKAVLRIAEGQKEDIKVEFAKTAIVQVLAEGTH